MSTAGLLTVFMLLGAASCAPALPPSSQRASDASARVAAVHLRFTHALPALRACYATAQRARPGVSGDVDVDLTIADDGHVADLSFVDDTIPDEGMLVCVRKAVEALRFDEASSGLVRCKVPLRFGGHADARLVGPITLRAGGLRPVAGTR